MSRRCRAVQWLQSTVSYWSIRDLVGILTGHGTDTQARDESSNRNLSNGIYRGGLNGGSDGENGGPQKDGAPATK